MADDLVLELKKLIINTLKLEDITPVDIVDDAPLFGEGLGLDSIDALELVVSLEKTYGVFIPDVLRSDVFQLQGVDDQFLQFQNQVVGHPSSKKGVKRRAHRA